jgi:hypothetical protein
VPDDWSVKHLHADMSRLTEWAIEARYPGEWEEASLEDAQWANRQATEIYEAVQSEFLKRGITIG